jgi:N4-gp56 family major capsid protein
MAGQIWSLSDEGGYMWAPNLSEYLRLQNLPVVKFRQLCDVKEYDADGKPLVGKGRGDHWYWNVYTKVATKGRPIDETERMPETGFKIYQNSGTIVEYGNAIPYSGKLDDLSEQPIREIINKTLKIDVAETFDIAAWAQFNATPLKVSPGSGTSATTIDAMATNGIPTATVSVPLGKGHIEPISTAMKERNIPAFENGDYMAIARPTTYAKLKSDLEGIQTYTETGLAQIKNGEIGRYRGVRFIEQTHIPAGGAAASWTAGVTVLATSGAAFNPQTGTSAAWAGSGATNGTCDWVFFMGADTVAEGIAIPEEIRGKIPDDYGRGRGIAWYALEGFGISHPYSENSALDCRIVKWDSLN